MTYSDYLYEVIKVALTYGYSQSAINCFEQDIQDCYDRGCTVEECVEEVF